MKYFSVRLDKLNGQVTVNKGNIITQVNIDSSTPDGFVIIVR